MHHLLEGFTALGSLHVLVLAQFRVLAEEFRVASFKQVAFRIEESWVSVRVDVTIKVAHAKEHIWSPLHTVLTVEN